MYLTAYSQSSGREGVKRQIRLRKRLSLSFPLPSLVPTRSGDNSRDGRWTSLDPIATLSAFISQDLYVDPLPVVLAAWAAA
jgi:hypothetical protein